MQQLDAAGICVFCPQHLDQEALHRSDYWTVTHNEYPYPGTALHLLLIPRDHVTDLLHLPWPARDDLWRALRWVKDTYQLGHYTLGGRCGDMAATGATIAHVHIHVVVANGNGPPVRFRMSGRRADTPHVD